MKAVFLDRDGTLNDAYPSPPKTIAAFGLLPGVEEGCKALRAAGYKLVVVTNQPDVGRNLQSVEASEEINRHLLRLLPQISHIEVCYDAKDGESNRRKPRPGMLIDAAKTLGIDLAQSWMIGDRRSDAVAGLAAGCRAILLGGDEQFPAYSAKSFNEAIAIILSNQNR